MFEYLCLFCPGGSFPVAVLSVHFGLDVRKFLSDRSSLAELRLSLSRVSFGRRLSALGFWLGLSAFRCPSLRRVFRLTFLLCGILFRLFHKLFEKLVGVAYFGPGLFGRLFCAPPEEPQRKEL